MNLDAAPAIARQANASMEKAATDVLLPALPQNTPIVVWLDNEVVEVDPFSPDIEPNEQSLPDGVGSARGIRPNG